MMSAPSCASMTNQSAGTVAVRFVLECLRGFGSQETVEHGKQDTATAQMA